MYRDKKRPKIGLWAKYRDTMFFCIPNKLGGTYLTHPLRKKSGDVMGALITKQISTIDWLRIMEEKKFFLKLYLTTGSNGNPEISVILQKIKEVKMITDWKKLSIEDFMNHIKNLHVANKIKTD